jgi:hypothetical protein
MPNYTRSDLLSVVKGRCFNKTGMLVSYENSLNSAVREVMNDADLVSSKRKYSSPPHIYTDIYSYTCPADLKDLIDIQPQVNRSSTLRWTLTSEEEFDRRKKEDANLVALTDRDLSRRLQISTKIDDETIIIGGMDNLTADGGTWTLFGDAENLAADTSNYVKGSGSIKWDISAAGGTTAGIYNSGLNSKDISDYMSDGSVFVWVYITSTTGLTNYILRLGSSTGNYHSVTVTTDNEGNAFSVGWNLLRFSLQSPTDTGTPVDTAITYAAIYMTKAATKISETDYRFDWMVVKKGDIYNIVYYSNYMWQSNLGVWKIDSTSDQDYLNVTNSEYGLIIEKATELANYELAEEKAAGIAANRYIKLLENYQKGYKSEKLRTTTQYYNI